MTSALLNRFRESFTDKKHASLLRNLSNSLLELTEKDKMKKLLVKEYLRLALKRLK
jgi:hypothetical protein